MDRWLLFDLLAPMASFGGPAPGSIRDTELIPARGAVLGLLAAALGIRRDEVQRLQGLGDALHFAVRVLDGRPLLRDYHTVQTPKEPKIKGRPRLMRRDELAMPRHELNTVLSDRYYHGDFAATIAIRSQSADWPLDQLAAALNEPRFALYLGRKSCPLHWPLDPVVLDAPDWRAALAAFDEQRAQRAQQWNGARSRKWIRFLPQPEGSPTWRYAWDGVFGAEGMADAQWVLRRDEPLDRQLWLFAERGHWRTQGSGGA